MCVTTVYVDTGGELKETMRDVVQIEAENSQLRLIDLFGKEQSVRGRLKHIDFWREHSVVIEQSQ
jgi:predicted RNA-binding protein